MFDISLNTCFRIKLSIDISCSRALARHAVGRRCVANGKTVPSLFLLTIIITSEAWLFDFVYHDIDEHYGVGMQDNLRGSTVNGEARDGWAAGSSFSFFDVRKLDHCRWSERSLLSAKIRVNFHIVGIVCAKVLRTFWPNFSACQTLERSII